MPRPAPSPDLAARIRAAVDGGATHAAAAATCGVSARTVRRILASPGVPSAPAPPAPRPARGGRPTTDAALLAEALALVASGLSPRDAAEQLRAAGRPISRSRISAAVAKGAGSSLPLSSPSKPPARRRSPPPEADDDEQVDEEIDATGTPLEVARALLAKATSALHKLAPDSPRRNPAAAHALALTKLLAVLQRAEGEKPRPEDLERDRRMADHETRETLERYVLQAEARAAEPRPGAPYGICIHCSAPMPDPSTMESP